MFINLFILSIFKYLFKILEITVFKASFFKAVLHSNRKNETHLGSYELKQEVKYVIKEIQK